MLSIHFSDDHEWWVSGAIFERLFDEGLKNGQIRPELAEFRHIADANGGLDFSLLDEGQAIELIAGMRRSAQREIASMDSAPHESGNQSYLAGLRRLLEVIPQEA